MISQFYVLFRSAVRVGGSVVNYLSRLMTSSTTTPYYSGTTDIVDRSSTGDYREIQPGRCLEFNGTTQYVSGEPVAVTELPVSISYWVWLDAVESVGLFYTHAATASQGIWSNTGVTNGVAFSFGSGGGLTSATRRTVLSSTVLETGKWNHVVGVIRGAEDASIWINGFADSISYTGTGGALDLGSGGELRIASNYDDSATLNGKMFDARIYNRVLTDDEITALYRQGLQPDSVVEGQPDATNLVGRWLLDDNSQTTAYDSSGNGNHGTIVGYASGMLYEGDDVPYSAQNLVGYSEGASSTFVPRDESDPANDVLGNPLDYTGTVPKYATPVDAPCLTFDGTTQYVDCGDAFTFYSATGDKPFRIASRVNIDTFTVTRPIISKYSDVNGGERQFAFEVDSSARLRLFVFDDSSAADYLLWTSQSSLSVNTDYLLEVSYDGNASENSVKLYINGELQNVTFTRSGNYVAMAECTESITVGSRSKDNVPFSGFFDGKIWDIKVYGDSDGINLIFWTPFSEGDGNTVYDVVNGNSYTITNYASTMWDNTQSEFFYSFENGCGEAVHYSFADSLNGWSSSAGADTGELTTFEGRKCLKVTIGANDASERIDNLMTELVNGETYNVSFYYYIPSTNQGTVLREAASCWTGRNGIQNATTDAWTQCGSPGNFVYDSSVPWRMYYFNGTNLSYESDVYYLADVVIKPVTTPIAVPALSDNSATVTSEPITGLPGLLNSDTYNLNLLPEPDAPYQRSAIPGATLDGVGDSVSVNNVDWNFTEDFEYEITAYLPAPTNQFLIGSATSSLRGIALTPFTGPSGLRFICGGFTANVDKFDVLGAVYAIDSVNVIKFEFESATGNVKATINGTEYTGNLSSPSGASNQIALGVRRQSDNADAFAGRIDRFYYSSATTSVEYDFRENNGLIVPDRSGNGNDGTLVVNSSLAQIFAPTPFETAYTLGDGRTRPHYVTVDGPNEKDFRTEII
jgi:hypothetical protein